MSGRQISLGAFLPGSGVPAASWRRPEVDVETASDFAAYARVAQKLEAGCFDTLFMNDSVGINDTDPAMLERNVQALRWDPLTLLPALAVVTSRIGLTATANTTYNDPFTLARRFAALDQISGGRGGWNCVTSLSGGGNFNSDEHAPHADRYERAEEFVDVIRGLWDSWGDGAMLRDKESGRWLDAGTMRALNHRGRFFQVKGPLNAPRSPQGRTVVFQAGSSDPGRELAARTGEVIFTAAQTIEEGQAFAADLAARAARHGRGPADYRIMPGVSVVTGATQAEAEAKYDRLHDLLDLRPRLRQLSSFIRIGVELADCDLDAPVPLPDPVPETNTHKSRQKLVLDLIRRENPTVRQLYRKLSAGGHRVLVGTPAAIADDFAEWFGQGAADGFNIMFPELAASVDDFVEMVVPELQRRGLFRAGYAGQTLRGHLGLDRPPSH